VITPAVPGSPRGRDNCCCGSEHLTHREIEVLVLLAADATTNQIATKLGISARTVEGHIASMMRRSRASSRAGMLARAYDAAILIPLPARWSGRRCLPWASEHGRPARVARFRDADSTHRDSTSLAISAGGPWISDRCPREQGQARQMTSRRSVQDSAAPQRRTGIAVGSASPASSGPRPAR
jgi:DNA-binding CsgD family transcriptional regulator